ncbi:MAG: LLM class flavin-dependent oxidoreductase [Gammaproteobacteria bacterium]
MKLSVLDQSPIRGGATPAEALEETIGLAQAADRLGYHRYWLAEHHNTRGFAGASPEIMVTRVAAATQRIRVGSGGVMLMHYSPFKVAENFRVLENLFPGRIDLGVGRAPGSDGITAAALAYGSPVSIEYFPAKVGDLKAFLTDTKPVTEALERVTATPVPESVPELWLLGSSEASAVYAAHFGLPFSFAHFISPAIAVEIFEIFRHRYQPSEQYPEPVGNLGVFVLCADSAEEAEGLARCRDLWRLRRDRGEAERFPTVEEALEYPFSDAEMARIRERREHQIVGTPPDVKMQAEALAERCGVDELVVLSITPDAQSRLRCYELLAGAFALPGRRS